MKFVEAAAIFGLVSSTYGATVATSHVKGKAFDRIAIIYFENQNYDKSFGDPNFNWFSKQGVTLSNYYAATHPSQPNYMAGIAGDYFGMMDDSFLSAPRNVSTVIDLLESKDISWAHYEEDMPYTGYQNASYQNQKTGANDYVRKHDPAILHDSVTQDPARLGRVKNLSLIDTSRSEFHKDLAANKLPQWMFITPNMTSDGHDSSITRAGDWCRVFLKPLLHNKNFMQNTMVLITWDESETYSDRNRILGILLGDAVPRELVGTEDTSFYTHYSEIATVEANWDLPTLGRWDVGANVYQWVASKTGDKLRHWDSDSEFQSYYWNASYAGYFGEKSGNTVLPKPNLSLDKSFSGRHILPSIKKTWGCSKAPTYYQDSIKVADSQHPPPGYESQD